MSKKIKVAIAILYQNGQFLLQLRDDIPNIVYPGCWGLFGGHCESQETPIETLYRELKEEIGYQVTDAQLFGEFSTDRVIRYVFYAPLTVSMDQLVLGEGWDFDLATPDEIRRGVKYSSIAKMSRPLGEAHQEILLNFLAKDMV